MRKWENEREKDKHNQKVPCLSLYPLFQPFPVSWDQGHENAPALHMSQPGNRILSSTGLQALQSIVPLPCHHSWACPDSPKSSFLWYLNRKQLLPHCPKFLLSKFEISQNVTICSYCKKTKYLLESHSSRIRSNNFEFLYKSSCIHPSIHPFIHPPVYSSFNPSIRHFLRSSSFLASAMLVRVGK